jgi:hypothetical protein
MHDPIVQSPSVDVLIAEEDPDLRDVLEKKGGRCTVAAKRLDAATHLKVVQEQVQLPKERRRSGLTLRQAEDLLDWLEANGCTGAEFAIEGTGCTVRWLETP